MELAEDRGKQFRWLQSILPAKIDTHDDLEQYLNRIVHLVHCSPRRARDMMEPLLSAPRMSEHKEWIESWVVVEEPEGVAEPTLPR